MVRGPTITPTGPKRDIPPSTEKSITNGGTFILPPIKWGFKILSTVPTTTIAHIRRPIAEVVLPVAKRKIIAGAETKAVPTIGISEPMAATTPQSAGFAIPKIQSPIDMSIP